MREALWSKSGNFTQVRKLRPANYTNSPEFTQLEGQYACLDNLLINMVKIILFYRFRQKAEQDILLIMPGHWIDLYARPNTFDCFVPENNLIIPDVLEVRFLQNSFSVRQRSFCF